MEETLETGVAQKVERVRVGPPIAIVVLVVMFVVGGVYFFLYEKARLAAPPIQQNINA